MIKFALMKNRKEEIKKFFENDKIIGKIAKEKGLPTLDIYGKGGIFVSLIEAIISQQLSGKAASTIYRKFESTILNKKDVAKYLSEINPEELRKLGISNSKSQCIITLSQIVLRKEIDIENLKTKNDREIAEILTRIKGIGIWTVNMFLMFGLKREDVWPATDYGIRKNLSVILKKKRILTVDETQKVGERWKPYRSYASCYIWNI